MRETASELDALQQLLDDSRAAAGDHLRHAFGDAPVTATDVVAAFDGVFELHCALVTSDGAPIVAPLDGMLVHGDVWIGFPAGSVRAGLVRRDPRISASYHDERRALIVHGRAVEVDGETVEAREVDALVDELYVAKFGDAFLRWRDEQRRRAATLTPAAFSGRIEARRLFVKLT